MQKWEYNLQKVYVGKAQPELDKYGKDGWELVGFQFDDKYWKFIFKRPL